MLHKVTFRCCLGNDILQESPYKVMCTCSARNVRARTATVTAVSAVHATSEVTALHVNCLLLLAVLDTTPVRTHRRL
jgi:hypothetical protein